MPRLGDYLGQLLSEIAIARLQADLETVRLAELYASHPLLRTLPVPHLKLPEVQLDLPILVGESEEPRPGESARGGVSLDELSRKFDEVLGVHLGRAGIALTAAERRRLRTALDQRLSSFQPQTETSVDVHRIADDLSDISLGTLRDLRPRPEAEQPLIPSAAAAELKEAVRAEFLRLRTAPPRLSVLVTSAELRELGTPDNLTRIHLKISEQGVEWTTIETGGVSHDRLVPE